MKRTILSAILLFVMAMIAQAQNITVHGTVFSKTDDEPLLGASDRKSTRLNSSHWS